MSKNERLLSRLLSAIQEMSNTAWGVGSAGSAAMGCYPNEESFTNAFVVRTGFDPRRLKRDIIPIIHAYNKESRERVWRVLGLERLLEVVGLPEEARRKLCDEAMTKDAYLTRTEFEKLRQENAPIKPLPKKPLKTKVKAHKRALPIYDEERAWDQLLDWARAVVKVQPALLLSMGATGRALVTAKKQKAV